MKNLADLSVDAAHGYIVDMLSPLAIEFPNDMEEDTKKKKRKEILKKAYNLGEMPAKSTIDDWLRKCGFMWKPHQKCFFVNSHESLPNHHCKKEQIAWYHHRERLMHRWYQVPFSSLNKDNAGVGFRYTLDDGTEMVELHVDQIPPVNTVIRWNWL